MFCLTLCVSILEAQLDLQVFPLGGLIGKEPEKGSTDKRRDNNDFSNLNKMKLKNDDLPLDTRLYVPPSERMDDYRTYYDVDESNSVD